MNFLYLLLIQYFAIVQAIDWQTGNWAMSCDFKGNDLKDIKSRGEDCGGICSKQPGCTHFTWTKLDGGTCWMKSGQVSKNNAFGTTDKTMACGIITSSKIDPGPKKLITFDEFQNAFKATDYSIPSMQQYENFINNAEPAGAITTKRELAMFLGF